MSILDGAVQFFGRVLAFDCTCPACGQILMARGEVRDSGPRGVLGRRRKPTPWNPITGRFRCTKCQRVFATGLLVYEVTGPNDGRPPVDHVPDARQRAAMRAQVLAGRWLPRVVRSPEGTNAIGPSCTCPDGGRDPACPIHP